MLKKVSNFFGKTFSLQNKKNTSKKDGVASYAKKNKTRGAIKKSIKKIPG
jgi:hypothetical protein